MNQIPILMIGALLSLAQQPVSDTPITEETTFRGRIILYDWVEHEMTSGDDFIVKTIDLKPQFTRVIYRPYWGFDAPASKDVLPRLAFIGRGKTWNFAVHAPRTSEERTACSPAILNHKYEDETGRGEIPRFVPTPGADTVKVPALRTLTCFILNSRGLTQSSSSLTKGPHGEVSAPE
jgi:hypothetical protein